MWVEIDLDAENWTVELISLVSENLQVIFTEPGSACDGSKFRLHDKSQQCITTIALVDSNWESTTHSENSPQIH